MPKKTTENIDAPDAQVEPSNSNDLNEVFAGIVDDAKPKKWDDSKRANSLDGKDWTRFSISLWSDIGWTAEERALKHPAKFPIQLVERLLRCFMRPADNVVLDPFIGSGSTLVAATNLGKDCIGLEVYQEYIDVALSRARQQHLFVDSDRSQKIHNLDARKLGTVVQPNSVDVCVTSPPYWNILLQKRTADSKEIRHYGSQPDDLGRIDNYEDFLAELKKVFQEVYRVLKPGKYCIVNVMDLRKGPEFYCYHADITSRLRDVGFIFDDLIIWDRRKDYNNMRALGYPYTFRVNKTHEYLLVFLKPRDGSTADVSLDA